MSFFSSPFSFHRIHAPGAGSHVEWLVLRRCRSALSLCSPLYFALLFLASFLSFFCFLLLLLSLRSLHSLFLLVFAPSPL